MQAIIDFITQLLSGIIDAFKMKNPVQYTVAAVILGIAYFTAGTLETATLPDGVTSLLNESTDKLMETVKGIVFTIATLIGAHTANNSTAKSV